MLDWCWALSIALRLDFIEQFADLPADVPFRQVDDFIGLSKKHLGR